MTTKPEPLPEVMGLPDPYETSLYRPEFRLNVQVATDDLLTIKAVAPSRGTIQYLVAAYIKSLADELRAKQLTYSPDNLRRFVDIVKRRNSFTETSDTERPPVERSAANGPTQEKRGRHVTRGTGRVRAGTSHTALKSTSSSSKTSKGE